jgi:D-alanyl-D-alanine dipeptidase
MGWVTLTNLPFEFKRLPLFKREGDGRSPAGVFRLSSAFGYAPADQARWIKLPYVQCSVTLECVDDGKSAYYNSVLERGSVKKPDWNSSEEMLRKDEQYRWGIVVDHNAERKPGGGSCIFMHIWNGTGQGTSGCTAMEAKNLERILKWLDSKAQPVLVQLPQAQYLQLQKSWRLPMIRP